MPNDDYFYLSRQLEKFMMSTQSISNLRGLVRTQNISTQKMSNLCVCYMADSESKSVHANESESKRMNFNVFSTDER